MPDTQTEIQEITPEEAGCTMGNNKRMGHNIIKEPTCTIIDDKRTPDMYMAKKSTNESSHPRRGPLTQRLEPKQ